MEGVMHNTMDGRNPAQLRQMISESALVFVTQHYVWDPAWVARTLLRLSTLYIRSRYRHAKYATSIWVRISRDFCVLEDIPVTRNNPRCFGCSTVNTMLPSLCRHMHVEGVFVNARRGCIHR
ncbi:unnamed protein product [Laminaria digitata]